MFAMQAVAPAIAHADEVAPVCASDSSSTNLDSAALGTPDPTSYVSVLSVEVGGVSLSDTDMATLGLIAGPQTQELNTFDNILGGVDAASGLDSHPSDGGSSPALHCNKAQSYSDHDGTMTLQYQCAYSVTNWGYKLSSQLAAIIVGPVNESGLQWWNNGRKMSNNSPHSYSAYATFHGTLNPTINNDEIAYLDHYSFNVEVNGRSGHGTLDVDGQFHTVDR
jgi:hypothetical protein